LILDDAGLGKQMLLYAPLCTVIQEILERLFTELAETTVLRRPFQIFTTR